MLARLGARKVLTLEGGRVALSYRLARRICRGVCPVCLRRTFVKWDASENPARRPISAVVMRA
jgi:hypothetical protein